MNDDMAEKWMIIRKQTNENSVLTYIHCEKFYCLEKKREYCILINPTSETKKVLVIQREVINKESTSIQEK
jgi:hypothetical protein